MAEEVEFSAEGRSLADASEGLRREFATRNEACHVAVLEAGAGDDRGGDHRDVRVLGLLFCGR